MRSRRLDRRLLAVAPAQRPGAHAAGLRRADADPVEAAQVAWMADWRLVAEVGGRGEEDQVARRQVARHHPGRQFETTADGGVEAFADEVDLAIVEMPVGHDVRIAFEELAEQRQDVVAAEGQPHADLQRAAGLVADAGDVGESGLDALQAAADLLQETLPGFGQGQAPGAALEQAHAEVAFQAGDVLAHPGRRQAQAPGGLGEATGLGAADEALDVAEGFHGKGPA